jgi:hypothetical protein
MENYLAILEESLKKKLTVLNEIDKYNNLQEQLLKKRKGIHG